MGLIILLIVVAVIWAAVKKAAMNTIDNAYANHQKKEEERWIDDLNSNTDRLQSQWERRVRELNIDLNKAVCVKYYTDYFRNKTLYLQSNGILQRIKTKHHNKFRREVLEKHGGFVPHAVMNGKRLLTAEVVAMVVQFVRVRAVSKVNK